MSVRHRALSCGIAGYDFGQHTSESYFGSGDAGYHWMWDSRLYNYDNWEVQRFLLSNLRYWVRTLPKFGVNAQKWYISMVNMTK